MIAENLQPLSAQPGEVPDLTGKRIVLGITGSIAAYKGAELARRLQKQGATVRVVMTASAQEFITPLTLQAVSGNPVRTELLDHTAEGAMGHLELARWADLVLIAPASANFIAGLANGMADDLLATVCLATTAPLLVAPAMNRQMWQRPATQENCARLQARAVKLLGPAAGEQACGDTGPGRMVEPEDIVKAVAAGFMNGLLAGLRTLVSAGPTREFIDPVRYLSNRSSGRMGYAVAAAALEAGAAVTLVTGPVALAAPARARVLETVSAAQMHALVTAEAVNHDIFIAAAAVADYCVPKAAAQKLKKRAASLDLRLEKTPDILAEVAGLANPPFTVGFAAETERLRANAQGKLKAKKLDMIAANQVSEELGFDSDVNALEIYWRTGSCSLETAPKAHLARRLIELIAARYRERSPAPNKRKDTAR